VPPPERRQDRPHRTADDRTKSPGRLSYAILSFGGFLGLGADLLPLPWAKLRYNTRFEAYEIDIEDDELKRAPSFRADQGFRLGRSVAGSRTASLLRPPRPIGRFLIARSRAKPGNYLSACRGFFSPHGILLREKRIC